MRLLHRSLPRWLCLAAIAIACVALQWLRDPPELLHAIEHLTKDAVRRAAASDVPESRLVVVDIDEASIAAQGRWPWPRARVADLVEQLLAHYRARAVGLDVVFPDPADVSGDERLHALGLFAPLVFAQALDFTERGEPMAVGVPVLDAPPLPPIAARAQAADATGFVANHAGLATVQCVGNIGILPDRDGRVRRVPLLADLQGRNTALLPLAMLFCPSAGATDQAARAVASLRRAAVDLAAWEVPFSRRFEAYDVVPAAAILDGSAPMELLRGRWVLVGSSALGLNDRAATPLASSSAGVMVHAAAMTTLLDRAEGRITPPPVHARWVAAAWTAMTVLLAGWLLGRFRAWWLIPGAFLSAAAWLALAAALLPYETPMFVSGPLLAAVLVLFYASIELWRTQNEQGQLLRSFNSYVAPAVVSEMLRQGIDNPMRPRQAEITVVSADMQDYSGHTNRATLDEAAALTTEFLHCLTEPIFARGGTLDKYTGDGLVAFWGAPLPREDHARQAILAAGEMVDTVHRWNLQRTAAGKPPVRVRIGVESGPVLVGDLGTSYRSTYTAVGDCINLASKLQGAARQLPQDVVVGAQAAAAADGLGLVPVAELKLPGFTSSSVLWSFPVSRSSLP